MSPSFVAFPLNVCDFVSHFEAVDTPARRCCAACRRPSRSRAGVRLDGPAADDDRSGRRAAGRPRRSAVGAGDYVSCEMNRRGRPGPLAPGTLAGSAREGRLGGAGAEGYARGPCGRRGRLGAQRVESTTGGSRRPYDPHIHSMVRVRAEVRVGSGVRVRESDYVVW